MAGTARRIAVLGRLLTLGAALLLLAPTWGWAQEDDEEEDLGRERAYIGVAGFAAIEDSDGDFSGLDNGGGGTILLGYRMVPIWALELQGDGSGGYGSDVTSFAVTVNTKFIFPIGRFHPYIKGGAGIVVAYDDDDSNLGGGFRAGGGFDFWFTDRLAGVVNAEYVAANGQASDFNYTSVGLGINYSF